MTKSKKICLMGASGVGKTSLVKRFVEGIFDETYRTTIGVHINKKCVACDVEQIELKIWDLEGKDDPREKYPSMYLDGAEGYMLVVDVTRSNTLNIAKDLLAIIVRHRKEERMKKEGIMAEASEEDSAPVVLLLNKQDLPHPSSITEQAKASFGHDVGLFKTSAKLDEAVDQAFDCLVNQILEIDRGKSPGTYNLQYEDP